MEWKIARRVIIVLGLGALFCLLMLITVADMQPHQHSHHEKLH